MTGRQAARGTGTARGGPWRQTAFASLAVCTALAGCSSAGGGLGLAESDWSMPSLSLSAFEMPEGGMSRLLTDGGGGESFERVTPVTMTAAEDQAMRRSVEAAFPLGWDVKFLAVRSGTTRDGRLVSCGLASAGQTGTGRGWSGVYRTETDRLTGATQLREIAGDGSARLVAYTNCQSLGLA